MIEPFVRVTSIAAPLWQDEINTEQLISGRHCVRPQGADYADALLSAWRYREDGGEDPAFILNREPYRTARILVTGANFGCGSSREHAVWAVRDFGFKALVAPSFASIFASSCIQCGILPVALPREDVEAIVAELEPAPAELTVDLAERAVVAPSGAVFSFDLAPLDRELLLRGVDALDLAREHEAEIAAFQSADRARRPWIYEPLDDVTA